MDEHTALVDESYVVRHSLQSGDRAEAMTLLTGLVTRLERHVRREEDGIFRALRDSGEFLDEVDALKGEHEHLEKAIASLDPQILDFPAAVSCLLDDLAVHIDREDYGIFPVSVVTLGAAGWTIVDQAHATTPSFLLDPTPPRRS
ncbi:hemerythrin domain-containing protein [Nocardioides cynanchi]|uniref:hemerythrin domain-containing protein n=1 Tax=Nocardioides cynanchi TaxID=2558918 RepID=UPI00177E67AC|nr:hemerythrin domain-containing protein [Nocardioides cynanchi]